jgi:hypothetical protein
MSEDYSNMTGPDLLDWLAAQGCSLQTLPPHKGNAIRVYNPRNDTEFFIGLPLSVYPLKDYFVFRACSRLGVEAPSQALRCKGLHDRIENDE